MESIVDAGLTAADVLAMLAEAVKDAYVAGWEQKTIRVKEPHRFDNRQMFMDSASALLYSKEQGFEV